MTQWNSRAAPPQHTPSHSAAGGRETVTGHHEESLVAMSHLLVGFLLEVDNSSPPKILLIAMLHPHQSARLQERHTALRLGDKHLWVCVGGRRGGGMESQTIRDIH